jgi:uncharacterized protein (TIGR04551 family)
MSRRRRLNVFLSSALAAPLLFSAIARAEDAGSPAAPAPPGVNAPSSSASPEASPSPSAATGSAADAPPAQRPPLITAIPEPAAEPSPAAPKPVSSSINPARDQQALATQGTERPITGELANPQEVFSEDWWGQARPVIEMHGFFRTRAELFHNFFLNRHSSSLQGNDPQQLWPIPLDQSYAQPLNGNSGSSVALCGPATPLPNQPCYDKTETSANVRLRLDPEIHISDNLRILSEVDALDNLVLGSTPNSYASAPATSGMASTANGTQVKLPAGYQSAGYNPYAPLGFLSTTQGTPTAGVNSSTNSISVKRVWGEYMTPVGQLRFGRMPSQWGLGMVDNAGDGIDSDYQTTVDRIMFITGIKSMDLYFGGAWDFVSTGPTTTPGANASPAFNVYGGQPYSDCNLCNVNEWAAFVAHRTNPELQKLSLAQGDVVVNGGLYSKFRSQYIDVAAGTTPQTLDASSSSGLEARQAWALTPDVWVQALWKKLRVEAEFAMIYGEIGNIPGLNSDVGNPVDIRQFGLATQTEFRAIDDKLDLQFGFGWSSGDPWAYNQPGAGQPTTNLTGSINPSASLPREFNTYGPMSTFAFHPDYRVDLIFYRNILSRVEGSYYFRPSVDYDFIRHGDGEKLGGGAAIIWSRASQFVQSPGHQNDLGVELDLQLYYQSKDGSLNDDPTKIGGFYTMLQYGVFFPFGGLDYLSGQVSAGVDASLSAAQTVRLFLGVVF